MNTISRLEATIAERRSASPESSYVAKLHAAGMPLIARKVGEEGVEVAVAALTASNEELVGEAADLLFHLLIMLGEKNIAFADVLSELDRRDGVSGLVEKASRSA